MKKFLADHPASYVTVIAMIATILARLSSKLGLPLSDQTATEMAQIIGVFGLAFVGYLTAHMAAFTHGTAMSGRDLVAGGIEAGVEAAEDKAKADLLGAPAAKPPTT